MSIKFDAAERRSGEAGEAALARRHALTLTFSVQSPDHQLPMTRAHFRTKLIKMMNIGIFL